MVGKRRRFCSARTCFRAEEDLTEGGASTGTGVGTAAAMSKGMISCRKPQTVLYWQANIETHLVMPVDSPLSGTSSEPLLRSETLLICDSCECTGFRGRGRTTPSLARSTNGSAEVEAMFRAAPEHSARGGGGEYSTPGSRSCREEHSSRGSVSATRRGGRRMRKSPGLCASWKGPEGKGGQEKEKKERIYRYRLEIHYQVECTKMFQVDNVVSIMITGQPGEKKNGFWKQLP